MSNCKHFDPTHLRLVMKQLKTLESAKIKVEEAKLLLLKNNFIVVFYSLYTLLDFFSIISITYNPTRSNKANQFKRIHFFSEQHSVLKVQFA